MTNEMMGLRLTKDLADGQVEQIPEQHPANHGVRNNEYAPSTEVGNGT